MRTEERYLSLLGVRREAPTLSFLTAIVNKQLANVPYENISKLVRFDQVGPSIPSLEEYVEAIANHAYGGTCFTQNIYLNHLLNDLGFDSTLVGHRRDNFISHVSLRVNIEGANYLVDVGIMSSFAGPFRLHPDNSLMVDISNQTFKFSPKFDLENYRLEIWRDGKMIREFESTSEPVSAQALDLGIRKTFEPSALFMTTLCVHRAFEAYSIGVWNQNFYKIEGAAGESRQLHNYTELKSVFDQELMLTEYPLDVALSLLRKNGAAAFLEE